jgi:hypothetical protein
MNGQGQQAQNDHGLPHPDQGLAASNHWYVAVQWHINDPLIFPKSLMGKKWMSFCGVKPANRQSMTTSFVVERSCKNCNCIHMSSLGSVDVV